MRFFLSYEILTPCRDSAKTAVNFFLLVLVNAFVGAMIGLERAVIPGFAGEKFGIEAPVAVLGFITAFGITKAISNYAVGRLTRTYSRRSVLIAGWIIGLPVPFLLMFADSWSWIIFANILLGINQGLTWSVTVIMKIDLVGPRQRGLAMGINEFAGYLAVGLASFLATGIAARHGYIFYPFIPGILFAVAGLLLSWIFVKDTRKFIHAESSRSTIPFLKNIWKSTSWKHPNLGSVTLNGLINNLNDAVVWGLLPMVLLQRNFPIEEVGIIAGAYPVVWGIGQLVTGSMGDYICKKQLIISGMLLQAIAISVLAFSTDFPVLMAAAVTLGLGTALVYPNFNAVIAENTHPVQRAESLSIFRFWRDSGYVAGAFLAGTLAGIFGSANALLITAILTAVAGFIAYVRMCCTGKTLWSDRRCTTEELNDYGRTTTPGSATLYQ